MSTTFSSFQPGLMKNKRPHKHLLSWGNMKIFIATFPQECCSKAASINPWGNAALHYLHPQNFASRSCLHGARRRPPFKLSPRPTRWLTERVIVINGPARRLRNLRTVTVQSSRITKRTASDHRGLFRECTKCLFAFTSSPSLINRYFSHNVEREDKWCVFSLILLLSILPYFDENDVLIIITI